MPFLRGAGDILDCIVGPLEPGRKQGRSVNVDFGVVIDAEDNTDYRIVSVDVVPTFADGDNYEIPDNESGEWIETNPDPVVPGARGKPPVGQHAISHLWHW